MTKDFLTEDVPGGASYWYTFGSATLFAMILQITTGIFLTFYYAPSTATAWESTKYIIEKVPAGHLVLSLHYWGATAMIAFMMMHMLQVLLWGAYKKPRELQWIVGVILFIVTLVLGLTGYLLAVGPQRAARLEGRDPDRRLGADPGQADPRASCRTGPGSGRSPSTASSASTCGSCRRCSSRWSPCTSMIFRWNGPAGPPIDEKPKLKPGRFWPDQMFMDTRRLVRDVRRSCSRSRSVSPAPLDAKADPNNTQFVPYPAWYFLALFSLLDVVGNAPDSRFIDS